MNKLAPYAKTVVAVLGVVLTVLNVLYGSDPRVQLAIVLATALGVYHTANASK